MFSDSGCQWSFANCDWWQKERRFEKSPMGKTEADGPGAHCTFVLTAGSCSLTFVQLLNIPNTFVAQIGTETSIVCSGLHTCLKKSRRHEKGVMKHHLSLIE